MWVFEQTLLYVGLFYCFLATEVYLWQSPFNACVWRIQYYNFNYEVQIQNKFFYHSAQILFRFWIGHFWNFFPFISVVKTESPGGGRGGGAALTVTWSLLSSLNCFSRQFWPCPHGIREVSLLYSLNYFIVWTLSKCIWTVVSFLGCTGLFYKHGRMRDYTIPVEYQSVCPFVRIGSPPPLEPKEGNTRLQVRGEP